MEPGSMLKKTKKLWVLNRKIRFLKQPREWIEKHQFRKLKVIIEHAYATVPYYRDLFSRHHLKPEDINSFQDLKKIPLTSKKDIVSLDRNRITSDSVVPEDTYEIRTSGSTGEPFRFLLTNTYGEQIGLDCIRSKFIHGLRPTDRILRIGGDKTITEPPGNIIKRALLRKAILSSFTKPEEILGFYNRFRPNVIRGFISNLYLFALWLEENHIRLEHVPRFILCSAEMAHAFMTKKVSETFRTKVVDRYATAELGVVADTCDHGDGYHIFEDAVYAEYAEVNGITYFVGTSLNNFATPFIRYNTFDICERWPDRFSRCSCGLNTAKFMQISGRDNDFIRIPDGRLLGPMTLVYFMRKNYHLVKQFRFIQDNHRTVRTEIVTEATFSEKIVTAMASELNALTGGLQVDIHICDHIPLEKSGKMRIIKSTVRAPCNHAN
jgi:phenylacetate-CoA ligase